ncbi:NAD-dependent epimerase/dehydratase family protein [Microvirga sp. M2]|uniref:NAD-dependent epimerase/dehydratase family protein n=1 Tax=Microvirga sp. M2 TaxID=3073270 RepID=UPI0039C1EADB
MSEPAVLVTGAAGLLGNAVRALLEADGRRVVPIDRVSMTEEGRPIVVCDLSDVHRLHALSVESQIVGIVHCGAHSGPMVARDNPYSMVQVNIVGTANVLEIARIHGARFVFCSSTSAYGNTPGGPVPEDVLLVPTSVYGASKVAGEQLVSAYSKQYGVDGVSLRLSWVYGPRRTTDCIVRTMIEDALAGRPTRKLFGRDFHRQFIHVDDAARAFVMALNTPHLPRQSYNVTGGTYLTLGEIGDIVRRVLPQAEIELGEGPDPVDDMQHRFDVSAVQRDLRFQPEISLEHGVRDYAAWLRNRAAA